MTLTLPCFSIIKEALLNTIIQNQEHSIFDKLDPTLDLALTKIECSLKWDLKFPTKTKRNWAGDFKSHNKNFTYYYTLLINLANRASTPSNIPEDIWLGLINQDFAKVNCLIALVAWLTTDEWRWHKEYPHYNIPEDLNYGLVLQEPLAVIYFAMYVLGYDRKLDYNTILETKESLNKHFNK
jgi:hypothetical protein